MLISIPCDEKNNDNLVLIEWQKKKKEKRPGATNYQIPTVYGGGIYSLIKAKSSPKGCKNWFKWGLCRGQIRMSCVVTIYVNL